MEKRITRQYKRNMEEENNFFFGLAKVQRHFFKWLPECLQRAGDKRAQPYITYGTDHLLMTAIMKSAVSIESMRGMDDAFNTGICVKNICRLLGREPLETLPHHDTVNGFLKKADPEDMDRIRTRMIKGLLKGRHLERHRLQGRYWMIVFDGTKLFHFKERHCEHCLKKSRTNPDTGEVTEWYEHYVLEAKLVCGDMALSMGSEFIENEAEDVEKQDCEQKAFKRLAARIRSGYPKLPVCVIADSLYCSGPVMDLCREYGWQYLLRFKQGSIPTIAEEFRAIAGIGGLESNEDGTVVYANGISYQQHEVNIMEMTDVNRKKETVRFTFITGMRITKRKAAELAMAGRGRWKIENEGFNTQKNHRYYIEHACSLDYNAMKCHYLLAQIADIWVQLFENGIKAVRAMNCGIKRISSLLKEAIRTRLLTEEDMLRLSEAVQIRFT